jgi:sulfite exporter TauE/SafE
MTPVTVKGFLLGLTAGTLCLTHCASVLLPVLAVSRDGTLRTSLLRLAEFSAGRALAYLAVGFLLGWAGPLAAPQDIRPLLGLLYVPLGALMLLHLLRESDAPSWACRLLQGRRRWVRTPLALGALTGAVPCAPFGLAMVAVLEGAEGSAGERALRGLVLFGAFFLGTTLFLLPLASAGLASRFSPVRRLARSAALLAALFFMVSGLHAFLHPEPAALEEHPPLEVREGDLRYVFPDADGFSSRIEGDAFPYFWALRKGREKGRGGKTVETTVRLGVCFVTTQVVSGVCGWAGEVPVLVGLTAKGVIRGIKVLEGANRETPGFVDDLYEEDFDRQFVGKPANDPLELGDVDGVTGATVSVQAVTTGVRLASRKAARDLFGIVPRAEDGGGGLPLRSLPGPVLFLLIVAGGVAVFHLRPQSGSRIHVLLGSTVLLGAWQGFYLTGADLSRAFLGSVPPAPSAVPWVLLVGAATLLAVLWGKIYCAWVCPFGALSELLFRVTPWKLPVSEAWAGRLRKVRFLFLLAVPALIVIADDPGAARFEPLSSLFHPASLTVASAVLLAWVLVGSVGVERFYCKFLCPVGALADALTASRLLGRKEGRPCGGCYRGEKGCRYLREEGPDFAVRRERLQGDCIC